MKTFSKLLSKHGLYTVVQTQRGFEVRDSKTDATWMTWPTYREARRCAEDGHATELLARIIGVDQTAAMMREYGGIDGALKAHAEHKAPSAA